MMPEIPADLLEGLKRGDPDAQTRAIDWLWSPLLRYVACRLERHQRDESEDLVQSTLQLAFAYRFYDHPAPVPYVLRILKSQLSRYFLRPSHRHPTTSLDRYDDRDDDAGTIDVKDEFGDRPHDRLDAAELMQAFRELSPADQAILWGRYVEEKNLSELAESGAVATSTVFKRLGIALRAFRRILAERGFAESADPPQRSYVLGVHPDDGQPITFVVRPGAARHYLLHNGQKRAVPRDASRGGTPPRLEEAVELLRAPAKQRQRRER